MPTESLTVQGQRDERLVRSNALVLMLRRPEIGATVAALAVFIFFSTVTNSFLSPEGISIWLYSSSLYGIMAVGVAMLMIGGEFDLSTGTMVGTTGLIVGSFTTQWGVNIWVAMAIALAAALAIGFFNGMIVMKTGLPSFIVTLGTFFILQGLNVAGTKLITGTVSIQGMDAVPGFAETKVIFGTKIAIGDFNLATAVIWWLVIIVIATFILTRSRVGNWIFAVGGQAQSARQTGVPVFRTKVGLFMTTAAAGWLVGMLQLFDVGSVQATTGIGQEFIYIICAVIGGTLLTGGFGSAIGPALGALIYGMTLQGIIFAHWDNNWLKAFLGAMLLLAVMLNLYVRRQAGGRE